MYTVYYTRLYNLHTEAVHYRTTLQNYRKLKINYGTIQSTTENYITILQNITLLHYRTLQN